MATARNEHHDTGITETLSPAIPEDIERAAEALLKQASERKRRLATAESCTGGLLASLLTDVEGLSSAFERGFVVYSIEAKCDLLGLRREQVESCGAVSRETATAMAEGAIEHSKADVALAITGFAGPAGPDDEPGLVHFACARRGGEVAHVERHFGDIGRGGVRIAALRVALEMMAAALS
jgi:nicotinamide-nucleotide amidase